MYTRHNNHKYVTQHNAHKYVALAYQNAHCHCNFMSHSMTQKNYRKHPPLQNTRHILHTKKAYHPRINKFANVECFYCMTKGHTSNVCFYKKLHLNMLPLDYLETNQLRPRKLSITSYSSFDNDYDDYYNDDDDDETSIVRKLIFKCKILLS